MRLLKAFLPVLTTVRGLFIVTLSYKSPLKQIDKHLEKHKAFLTDHYDKGVFIASGAQKPRNGGVIIASLPSREILDNIMKQDPFHKNGVSDYVITEFSPSMCCKEFEEIKDRDENIQNK